MGKFKIYKSKTNKNYFKLNGKKYYLKANITKKDAQVIYDKIKKKLKKKKKKVESLINNKNIINIKNGKPQPPSQTIVTTSHNPDLDKEFLMSLLKNKMAEPRPPPPQDRAALIAYPSRPSRRSSVGDIDAYYPKYRRDGVNMDDFDSGNKDHSANDFSADDKDLNRDIQQHYSELAERRDEKNNNKTPEYENIIKKAKRTDDILKKFFLAESLSEQKKLSSVEQAKKRIVDNPPTRDQLTAIQEELGDDFIGHKVLNRKAKFGVSKTVDVEDKVTKAVRQVIVPSNLQDYETQVNLKYGHEHSKEKAENLNIFKNEYADNENDIVIEPNVNIQGSGKANFHEGLYDDEIDRIMVKYPEYLGTICRDEINSKILQRVDHNTKKLCFIMNTSNKNQQGTHWQALYVDKSGSKSIEFYDSFGRAISDDLIKDLKPIISILNPVTLLKIKSNKIIQQNSATSNCGWFCCQFLMRRLNGVTFSEASGYDDRVKINDSVADEKEIEKFKENMFL